MKVLVLQYSGECIRANALKVLYRYTVYGKIKNFEFPSLMCKIHNITYRVVQ